MQHPSLPPLYTLVALEGDEGAREHACLLAAEGVEAGHFVWAAREDRFDCAVVLRPDDSPDKARPAVLVAALALFDAVGVVAPAGLNADLAWPGLLRVNGGVAGGITLRAGPVADEDGVLEWLVVAARLRMDIEGGQESGDRPDITWLRQEGCAEVETHVLAEAFGRYFLSWMDRWENDGFEPVARSWMNRATTNSGDAVLTLGSELIAGTIEGLDDAGGLILDTSSGQRILSLAHALGLEIDA